MKLSLEEQETIILFNRADEYAEIEAYDARLKKRLTELHEQRPNDVRIGRVKEYATVFTFPKSWIRINPPRSIDMDEKQKEALRERAKINFG